MKLIPLRTKTLCKSCDKLFGQFKLIRQFLALLIGLTISSLASAQTSAVLTAEAPILVGGPNTSEISFDVSQIPEVSQSNIPSGIPSSKLGLTDINQPSLTIRCIIYLQGIFPSRNGNQAYIGEIGWVGYTFAPRTTADCSGQLLAISQNQALFSLLGTTYGGDGRTSFGLPEMRGRAPVHVGQGSGLPNVRLGQRYGSSTIGSN